MVAGPVVDACMQTVFITHPTHKFDTYFGQTALAQLQKVARVRCNSTQDDLVGVALLRHIEDCAVIFAAVILGGLKV